jgi:opacity protein-like surface antigen
MMRHFLLTIALSVAAATPAAAQRFDDTLSLRVEAYFAGISSSVRVDGNNGNIGTEVDFENDLGLADNKTLPAFELGWRINDDWVVQGQYYSLGRETQRTLDREITIGDTVYPVNGSVGAGFDSDVYRLTIGNLLIQREKLEIGVGIGFHGTDFAIFVEGNGSVNGQPGQFRQEGRSIFAPLPTIGAFGQWEPADRVTLSGRLDWLSLTIDDYNGRLINAEAAVAYRLFKHLDAGVAYRYVDYRLRVNQDDWNGRVRYQFSGPSIFLRAGF